MPGGRRIIGNTGRRKIPGGARRRTQTRNPKPGGNPKKRRGATGRGSRSRKPRK